MTAEDPTSLDAHRLLDHISEGLLVLDGTGRIVYANAAALALAGVDREQMIGRLPDEMVHPDDRAAVRERVGVRLRQLDTPSALEARVVRPDGEIRIIEFLAGSLFGENGPGLVVTGRDVTAQRLAERRLAESEERFRSLFHHTPQVVYDFDPQGVVTAVNPAALDLLGMTRAELEGRHFADLIHPDDLPVAADVFGRALAGDANWYELRVVRADGALRNLRGVTVPIRLEGQVVGVSGIAEDVTERRAMEAALARSEHRYRAVLERAADAIILLDEHFRIAETNGAALEMLAREREELAGLHVSDLVTEASKRDRPMVYEPVRAGHPLVRERSLARGDGGEVIAEMKVSKLGDGYLIIARDVTERRALEHQLLESQKMEAVGRLTGGVAHDFNNLLTAILGYTDLLLQEDMADPARADLAEIRKAADQAARLTQQLLAFSRRQMLRPERLDVNAVVGEMKEMLRRLIGEAIALSTELEPGIPSVKVDRSRLEQVLVNLVVNARDAMPDGGRLRIETGTAEWPGDGGERCVRISVTDTGSGIPEDVRDKIFEPFFTTKPVGQGTGLGLSTVYGIVEQSGGHLDLDTELGVGTTFRVWLPVVP